MSRLRAADPDCGGHGNAPLHDAADDTFWAAHFDGDLMATHSIGMSARQRADELDATYRTSWLLTQKLRRGKADPKGDLLEGVVEVDQTENPFRVGDRFFEPGNARKVLIAVAVSR